MTTSSSTPPATGTATGTDPPAESASPTPTPTAAGAPDTPPAGEPVEANREAAKYRTQLRTAESERDTLAARVATYERADAEQVAREAGMHDPRDLWQFGAELDECRGEDGAISAERVRAVVARLTAERPHLAAPRFAANPGQAAPRGATPPPASWSDVLGTR